MIQRVQTIFLFLAFLCALSLFVFALVVINQDGISQAVDALTFIPGGAIGGLIALLSFVNIFLYKNRELQIKICRLNLALTLLMVAAYTVRISILMQLDNAGLEIGPGTFTTVLLPVFLFFALIFIKKDEKLVRSLDRLR